MKRSTDETESLKKGSLLSILHLLAITTFTLILTLATKNLSQMIESFTSLPCLKLQILPLYVTPRLNPIHTHENFLCARNRWITLPKKSSSEWFRHSAGDAPTQCEVQFFVGGRRKKNKNKNLGEVILKKKVHCKSPARHAAHLSPEIIIPPVLKEVSTMPMIPISLANKSIYISTSHLYTKNTCMPWLYFFFIYSSIYDICRISVKSL